MRVSSAEPGDDDLGLACRLAVGADLVEENVRRIGDPDAAVADRDAGGNVQPLGEDRDPGNLAVGADFEHLDTIAPGPATGARILQALGDPHPAALVEGHGDGVDDIRLAGDQLNGEAFGDLHLFDGLGRRQRRSRDRVLAVRRPFAGRLPLRRHGTDGNDKQGQGRGERHGKRMTHGYSLEAARRHGAGGSRGRIWG